MTWPSAGPGPTAVQPLVHVYNGFLVHSRFGSGAPLSQSPQANVADPPVVYFRSDLGVPILDRSGWPDSSPCRYRVRTAVDRASSGIRPRVSRVAVAAASASCVPSSTMRRTETGRGGPVR